MLQRKKPTQVMLLKTSYCLHMCVHVYLRGSNTVSTADNLDLIVSNCLLRAAAQYSSPLSGIPSQFCGKARQNRVQCLYNGPIIRNACRIIKHTCEGKRNRCNSLWPFPLRKTVLCGQTLYLGMVMTAAFASSISFSTVKVIPTCFKVEKVALDRKLWLCLTTITTTKVTPPFKIVLSTFVEQEQLCSRAGGHLH